MQLEAILDCDQMRLDRFLVERIDDTSRAQIQEWIRSGRVQVDGHEERKGSRRLRGSETITVAPAERPPLKAVPEDIDIHVVYEDSHIAVVDKAAGMAVHAGAGQVSGTLVNALLHHFQALSSLSGDLRPGIVHRLDRYTSGLLVVAKDDRSHRRLQDQFQNRKVDKLYWAAVEGRMHADPHDDPKLLRHGRPVMQDGKWWLRIEAPIRRDKRNRVKMVAAHGGREAASDVRCLRSADRHALAEVRIHTGRTHQVRVHVASAGHPVVGDALYGARRDALPADETHRYLLHARHLAFAHPFTGESMSFESPLPGDFTDRLARLGL